MARVCISKVATMAKDLPNCVCGGTAIWEIIAPDIRDATTDPSIHRIKCIDCFRATQFYKDPKNAIKEWKGNKRP